MVSNSLVKDLGVASEGRGSPVKWLLQLTPRAACLDRLKTGQFQVADAEHLQTIPTTFLQGYNVMFEAAPLSRLSDACQQTRSPLRGFLIEGAGMGAAIRDSIGLRARHLEALSERFGPQYQYLIQVGSGWALARMPWLGRKLFRSLPPDIYTLTLDGRGFHDTYFRPAKALKALAAANHGLAQGAYDQGVGRALWFVVLANAPAAIANIQNAHPVRRANLLSGLGLAMTYAGPSRTNEFDLICNSFPHHRTAFLQGAAFALAALDAAKASRPDLNEIAHRFLGASPSAVASTVEGLRPLIHPRTLDTSLDVYETWRLQVQSAFGGEPNPPEMKV